MKKFIVDGETVYQPTDEERQGLRSTLGDLKAALAQCRPVTEKELAEWKKSATPEEIKAQENLSGALQAISEKYNLTGSETMGNPVEHQFGEAFMLMSYGCETCGKVEHIWNSRNGVSPFMVRSSCCDKSFSKHIDWHKDVACQELPDSATRVFVSYTEETAHRLAELKYEQWSKDGSFDEYPIPQHMGGVGGRNGFIIAKTVEYFGDGGQPRVITRDDFLEEVSAEALGMISEEGK